MKSISLLVVSCDKYSDLWPYFFELFFKYWGKCPYDIYLGSNEKKYTNDKVKNISVGPDQSWAINLKAMLDAIDSEYVILFLEDFFITTEVSTERVESLIDVAMHENLDCLRLVRKEKPKGDTANYGDLGEIILGQPFRISTQVAIWRKDFLYSFLHPSFTPWDFEMKGTELARFFNVTIWSVKDSVVEYKHAVERGQWLPQGLEICSDNGLHPDFSVRPKLSEKEFTKLLNRKHSYRNRLFKLFPKNIKKILRYKRMDIDNIIKDIEISVNNLKKKSS